MKLTKAQDLFAISSGDVVTKRNLYDLIQYSKVENSAYWSGPDWKIGNTPQQGINWVGELPSPHAVVIKTRLGSYDEDGWSDKSKSSYHYSFKARNGEISYTEKANQVLVQQPQHLYPILLFTEDEKRWRFEGSFSVSEIGERFVVLRRGAVSPADLISSPQDEASFQEGGRRYVTHLMVERNPGVIQALKQITAWVCDICSVDFFERYGVRYIEAHHKVPISTYNSQHTVDLSDLVLLCPNCHKAVHAYMKNEGKEYGEIKIVLNRKAQQSIAGGVQPPALSART